MSPIWCGWIAGWLLFFPRGQAMTSRSSLGLHFLPAAHPHFKHAAGQRPLSGPPSVYLRAGLGQEDVRASGLARKPAGEPRPGTAGRPEMELGLLADRYAGASQLPLLRRACFLLPWLVLAGPRPGPRPRPGCGLRSGPRPRTAPLTDRTYRLPPTLRRDGGPGAGRPPLARPSPVRQPPRRDPRELVSAPGYPRLEDAQPLSWW
jgi:hypothetical protein